MRADDWYRRQRSFYARRRHRHLEPSEGGFYAESLIAKLWSELDAPEAADGVEIGCGAGRFTFPLLARCRSLQAIDLSARQLEQLRGELAKRGVDPERCRLHEANVEQLGAELGDQRYDFVAGVFILHHLDDAHRTLERLRGLLRPGARIAFLEPNRWNPLYALQISVSSDMSWRAEWRLYQLSARRLRAMFEAAGFDDCRVSSSGFFPPQILNRFPNALRIEKALERLRLLRPLLPFLIVSGRRPPCD